MNFRKHPLVSALLIAQCLCPPLHAQWYKGNTHTHTINSGGDSTPDDVAKWYRLNGYDFLFITDHGMVTNVDPLNALYGGGGKFLVIRGEEVSSDFRGPTGPIHVHVNSLNPREPAKSSNGTSARDTLQGNLDAIVSAGGVAQINHPNYMWQLNADDIASVKGARLLEIMNMHPLVNSWGAGPNFPSAEDLWDQVLSRGVKVWGVASDDTHDFKAEVSDGTQARPGKGWIVVRAAHLTTGEIMQAINQGDSYASTGVSLTDYKADSKQITINIHEQAQYLTKYRTQFIGRHGVILQDDTRNPAIYSIKGDEGYVRARITDSNGKMAWTQPVFVQPIH